MRIQWLPNLVRSEKRICLTRIRWETMDWLHPVSPRAVRPVAYSQKVSLSIQWKPRRPLIGAHWEIGPFCQWKLWIYLLPCLPIRINYVRSYGGIIP